MGDREDVLKKGQVGGQDDVLKQPTKSGRMGGCVELKRQKTGDLASIHVGGDIRP